LLIPFIYKAYSRYAGGGSGGGGSGGGGGGDGGGRDDKITIK
jgi:hypothetical protein